MPDENLLQKARRIRRLPGSELSVELLLEYVQAGQAFDLNELCRRSQIQLNLVTCEAIRRGLHYIDLLPGYSMTREHYRAAEERYAGGASRRDWQHMVARHKPNYVEDQLSAVDREEMRKDNIATRSHYARVFYQAWAVFWDDRFVRRIIDNLDPSIIGSLPYWLVTEQDCFHAVSRSGLALRYVPPSFRTVVICARAVETSASAKSFVPPNLRAQVDDMLRQMEVWSTG